MRQVLQSVTGCYYKVRHVLQSVTVITKWDVAYLLSRNIKRIHTDQIIAMFCDSIWKVTTHKPSNAAVAKNFFSSVQVIATNFFNFPFDDRKTLFIIKIYCDPDIFFNCDVLVFFETSVLKEVRILHYLRSNSALLILKFQETLSCNIFAKCSKVIWFTIYDLKVLR